MAFSREDAPSVCRKGAYRIESSRASQLFCPTPSLLSPGAPSLCSLCSPCSGVHSNAGPVAYANACASRTEPAHTPLLAGALANLARTKAELVAENAVLRQQLLILSRQGKRPVCTKTARILLGLLARAAQRWKRALFIVQPDTLLAWHRQAFRRYGRQRSKPISTTPNIPAETTMLIQTMALDERQ